MKGEHEKMFVHIYRVNKDLPYEKIQEELECERWWDLDVSLYKLDRIEFVRYTRVDDLIEAIENKERDLKLELSDIIEMLPDDEMLNDIHAKSDLNKENDLNFLVMTSMGIRRVALDKKQFVTDLSLSNCPIQGGNCSEHK